MGDTSIGEVFERLVQTIRREHLATCVEFVDPIQAEIELIKQNIAQRLGEEYITLNNVHNYLKGDAKDTRSRMPTWLLQSDGMFQVRESCSKEFSKDEHKRRLISAVESLLEEHGFSANIDLVVTSTRCILKIAFIFSGIDGD